MSTPEPKILDVTLRDGSFVLNHQLRPQDAANISKCLESSGVEYIELSHGCGIGARSMGFSGLVDDDELLEAAKNAAPNLKFSVFISPLEQSLPVIPALVSFFEIGRVGTDANKVQSGEKFIQKLKKYDKIASVQLVRSHACSPESIEKSAKEAVEMGADIVYVVDTFGSMQPEDVKNYVSAAKSQTKCEIGFHGHNNLGLAIPNTLAALDAGATWLDASLMGQGKGAGNAVLETLIYHLQSRGLAKSIKLNTLLEVTEQAILPLFQSAPNAKLIDLLFAQEKIDYFSPELLELLATYIHQPLENFLTNLHAKMGTDISVADDHLRSLLKDYGADFDQVIQTLTSPQPSKEPNNEPSTQNS